MDDYVRVGKYGHVLDYGLWALMADLMDVSPSPQSIVLSTPTYLLCDRSVRRPEFSIRLGGGGGWCLNHYPLAHRRLPCYFRLCLRHIRHQIFRRYESPSSNICEVGPFPSVPRGIPALQLHQIFSCA